MANNRAGIRNVAAGLQIKTGMVLRNRYAIKDVLGKGGMGRVYLAVDGQNRCYVAIKEILLAARSDSTRLLQRFEQEYHFLSSVDHPCLLKALDFFQEREQLFMVIEFIEGVSLIDLIQKQPGSLSVLDQLGIANQIARGVEALNIAGIIHRDVKPANIMLDLKRGQVKLLDLGLGKELSRTSMRLTQDGDILGTPGYFSPEQTDGKLCESSDVFSLGVTLYQFFSWQSVPPFLANNLVNTIKNVKKRNLPLLITVVDSQSLSAEERKVYCDISAILARALAKNPKQRLAQAGLLASEMDRLYHYLLSHYENGTQQASLTKTWIPVAQPSESQTQILKQLGSKLQPKRRHVREVKNQTGWKIFAAILVVVCTALFAKLALRSPSQPMQPALPQQTASDTTLQFQQTTNDERAQEKIELPVLPGSFVQNGGNLFFVADKLFNNNHLQVLSQSRVSNFLTGLDLHETRVDDAGVVHIGNFVRLTSLNLEKTDVTDAGLEPLRNLSQLTSLNIEYTSIGDAGLAHIRDCTKLISLDLKRTKITDFGMRYLSGLFRLQSIDLEKTQIGDAGLEQLRNLTQLQSLDLERTQITDTGLVYLSGLTQLLSLSLRNTKVSDSGLEHIGNLPKLMRLSLEETQIGDQGLQKIANLANLRELELQNTKISDFGLEYIRNFDKLTYLGLRSTKVSDFGLGRIASLKSLTEVDLKDTKVSNAGLYQLRKALPNYSIRK